jgi:signal transduction histidine kinase/ligand-binding sensor domain-containing protein/DNA-binding response OmpR family regulator
MTSAGQVSVENNITIDNGLINNEVTAIHQDRYGFIWFGTRGGLNKYNGYEFNTIRSVPGSSNNLPNQAVEVIAESGNLLWIGNKTGGLNSYDILTDSITHYNPPAAVKIQEIKSLLVTKSGDLFIGALHGLYILRKGIFVTVDNRLTVSSLARDSADGIWVGTVFGLYKYNPQQNKLDSISLGPKRFEVTSIAVDNQSKCLFLGTWGNGLVRYNLEDHSYKKYLSSPDPGGLTSNNTYRVMIDRNRNVWVGTWGGGLNKFDINTEAFESLRIKPLNVFNTDYDIVLSILQDNAGILWIGTDGGGICKVDPYRKKFNTITNTDVNKPILENTHITAVYEDRHGGFWLGTKGGGLYFSADKKHFLHKDVGTNPIRVNTFFENNNDLWVGTGDGLVILKDYDHVFRPLWVKRSNTDTSGLSGPKVTAIVKDKNGIIWVGTQEHGLNRVIDFHNEIPVFKHYPERVGVAGAIQNDRISCMLVDKSNRLWVGTYDGLHVYNRENDNFELIKTADQNSKGLSNNTILSLAEDSYGTIWVGTQQGLNKLSFSESGKFSIESFYQCAGFPNDYVHAVLIDNENNVWMSTNKGITKYNIRTKNFRNFDIRDGVSSNTFSENISYRRPDGEMFFGSINGVTYFYPDSIYLNHYKPPVYITNLQINNQDVAVGNTIMNNKVLSKALFLTPQIKLSYKENIISFSFAALDYHASDKNQYQYQLEGFDDKWVDAGSRRTVTFTSLPSGSYTFKVRASNSDQMWSDDIATLQIAISAPPWKTWWAYLIYFLIIGGLLWLSRYIKLKRIYLQNRLAIANLNYEKEHEIAEIKSRFFTNISHEFRTPLTLMIGPLEDLTADDKLAPSVKSTIRKIQNQSKRLLSLINQLLDFHKAESNALTLNTAYHDIIALSKSVANSFEEEANRKDIQFVFQADKKELFLLIDKEKVESILYNLLSNAFKFTPPGGDIQFRVEYHQQPAPTCEIIVADTGKGVSAAEKGKIFDRYYQVAQAEPGKYMGTGIGLAFVKDLVELHNGSILLEDNQPQGSVFTITLPAKAASQPEEEPGEMEDYQPEELAEEADNEQAELPIVLVVEDNEELNQYLCKVLSKSGDVIAARDGKEGLEKAFQTIPDLVVSDVMMPGMDGYALCKSLKEDNRTSHIPVILLTAKSDDISHIEGIKQGADIYLGKPFKPALLTSHVKNLIQSRKKLKELFARRLNLEPSEVEVTSFDEEFIKNAIHFVEENIEKDEFSIDDLAVKLNMSRSTFYRKLKALTGMSGSDFIRTIKLKRSAQLLKSGEYTVSMAAFSSGFNDLKHFRKSFQKQFGVTPSEYMKRKA